MSTALPPMQHATARELFGIESDLLVPVRARSAEHEEHDEHVPEVDAAYRFDRETTLALLAGFMHNRRVLVQGLHGTGKSTHVEQVAARLGWPCIRVNLDGHISRLDLVGKDAVVLRAPGPAYRRSVPRGEQTRSAAAQRGLRDAKQVTEFQEGILPWALQRPVALVFDEYDAGRPDVMFVIQRVLEQHGRFTLMDQSRVLVPHPLFRLFATANTVGLGNVNGLYHGSQRLNHAQIDRWNIVASLNHLPAEQEVAIVLARVPEMNDAAGRACVAQMVALAALTRQGFAAGDLATLMSPRTVITWAENLQIFGDVATAFRLTFANKCEQDELPTVGEYFQRVFDRELFAS